VETSLLVAVIGFVTATLGLLAAILGRRKEVIHRHATDTDEAPGSGLRWGGILFVVVGIVVGLGMLGANILSRQGKLLFGPTEGKLVWKAGEDFPGFTRKSPSGIARSR